MENTNQKQIVTRQRSLSEVVKCMQVAEIQLIYKSNVKPSERPKISTSNEVYQIFIDTWEDTKIELLEQFKILLTNRANKVLGVF